MSLTIKTLERYLGGLASSMLADAPFNGWAFERSVETDLDKPRIDYVFHSNGLDLVCDGSEKIRTMFLYFDEDRFFSENVADFSLSWSRQNVIDRLGKPLKSGGLLNDPILGEFGPWDRFSDKDCYIHIEYRLDSDVIKKVTLMRADTAP